MKVVPGQEHGSQDFAVLDEMVQVGAAVTAAGRATAIFDQRSRVVGMPGVSNIQRTAWRERLPSTA